MQNLLKHCLNPESFLKPLAKLFSVVQNKLSRQTLCMVFEVLNLSVFDSILYYGKEDLHSILAEDGEQHCFVPDVKLSRVSGIPCFPGNKT